MRVTSKGQVTIPQDIRERLGIVPGSEVTFEVDDAGVRLVRQPTDDADEIVAAMRGRLRGGMTTDEILALTRGDD